MMTAILILSLRGAFFATKQSLEMAKGRLLRCARNDNYALGDCFAALALTP
jgi:hypothetical protein